MKLMKLTALLFLIPTLCLSQEIIELPAENTTGLVWNGEAERFMFADWQTEVVINVSQPTMEVFRPESSIANGSSVIIAPGGGLLAHSIEKEGNQVARWLADKGMTAFVLSYRLLPITRDQLSNLPRDDGQIVPMVRPVLPLSVKDGMNAVSYVRENADRWDLDPEKIGLMGFSAGGAVTVATVLQADEGSQPNYIVPVYPWMKVLADYELPEELPPMLVICASDDPLLIGPDSVKLYSQWIDEGGLAGMHMYSKGGHGFGMDSNGLPSDSWISRFYEWAVSEELVTPNMPR